MRDLVFVSLEDWDEVWRRNQFLCAEFMRQHPGACILFVGRSRDYSHAVRKLDFSPLKRPRFREESGTPGVWVLNPTKVLPNSLGVGRRWNGRRLLSQVRRAMDRLEMRNPILWINDHFAWPLVGRLGERAVVYDITDDWTRMPSIPASERAQIAEADRRLCRLADLVVVCSRSLEASRRSMSRRIERIPNGVDSEHYTECLKGSGVGAREKSKSASPVFGYVGSLHRDRLDLDLLEGVAGRLAGGRLVLCGPDFLEEGERRRLLACGNVEIRGAVAYREVPAVIAGFDVCIVPHRCTPFTQSLNPIKLWEYFASGKPVASTPVAGFADYPDLVHVGAGVDGFAAACVSALQEGGASSESRMELARANSWRARVEDLAEIFRQEGWMSGTVRRARKSVGGGGSVEGGVEVVCHG